MAKVGGGLDGMRLSFMEFGLAMAAEFWLWGGLELVGVGSVGFAAVR